MEFSACEVSVRRVTNERLAAGGLRNARYPGVALAREVTWLAEFSARDSRACPFLFGQMMRAGVTSDSDSPGSCRRQILRALRLLRAPSAC